MLGTTWSASRQAGKQLGKQQQAPKYSQGGVGGSFENKREREREADSGGMGNDGFGRVHGIGVGGRSHEGGK